MEVFLNMIPLTILWSLLAIAVIGLALYRKLVASREDDLIHVGAGEEELISRQLEIAQKLEEIDRLGKILTVVTLIFGLVIAAIFLYQGWVQSQALGQ
jgi:hypothetical protein